MSVSELASNPFDARRIVRLWWPLAASWLLMGVELPMVAAVLSRLDDPKVHLAAYGSVVFPIALVIEAPIIMLLAASTALCSDRDSYDKVRRFMLRAGACLTALHAAVAFSPLYDVVARDLLGAPREVADAGRLGLQLLTPWTWSIAWRRFQQGVLIRFERSRPVTIGTGVRLAANASTLALLAALDTLPGVAVAAAAVSSGVLAEALFIHWSVQPVLRERLAHAPPRPVPLTRAAFLGFYVPLALTPLMTLLVQPLGAAAMNRMPAVLDSTAAWPGVHGLVFLTRSAPLAFHEVVVALLGVVGARRALGRFTAGLTLCSSAVLLVLAFTPLGRVWFEDVSNFPPEVAELSSLALVFAVLMPAITTLQSWYTGALVHVGRTRPITEAVVIYLVLSGALLALGVARQPMAGILFALGAFTLGGIAQTAWLWWRSRDVLAGMPR